MIRAIVLRDPTATIATLIEIVEEGLRGGPLEQLHRRGAPALLRRETDQSTIWHRRFYDDVVGSDAWQRVYDRFVTAVVAPCFPGRIAYQAIPTLRVQFPGNVAVGEFHDDSRYGHAAEAVNIWVPLTPARRTAALHLANRPGPGTDDCTPVEVDPGQVLIFDGINHVHGNVPNAEGRTRVSFDLRVIPLAVYEATDNVSVNTSSRLVIGDYYREHRPS